MASGLALAACALAPAPARAVTAPSVSGHQLNYGDGSRFIVGGASVYMIPYYTSSTGGVDAKLQDYTNYNFQYRNGIFTRMKALGFNSVRLPVGIATYNNDVYGLGGKAGYLQRIADIVTAATNQNLYVVIGWWDSLGQGSAWPSQYSGSFQMMKDVYTKLGPNPMVMYEPWNEPNNVTWAQWDTVMDATIQQWRSVIGYTGVLFLDTTSWSWDFSTTDVTHVLNTDASYRGGTSNSVIANHRYANSNSCFCGSELNTWESVVGQYVGAYPIAGTEYGAENGRNTYHIQWNIDLLNYLAGTKVAQGFNGYWDFVWNWIDGNTMTPDADLATLNEHGNVAYTKFIVPVLGGSGTVTPPVTGTAAAGTNIALNMPAIGSSGLCIPSCGHRGADAFDGNVATYWRSEKVNLTPGYEALTVDLIKSYTFHSVVIKWGAQYAKSFTLQTSNDSTNWTTIYSTTTGTGGTQTIPVTGTGRFVKMNGTVFTASRDSVYVNEMEIYP